MTVGMGEYSDRCFLFLQGPHGPFFKRLGERLAETGANVLRLGFNPGDQMFWGKNGFLAFHDAPENLGPRIEKLIQTHGVTDIVCYGSSRPIHQTALQVAKAHDLTSHVFEEGYLRPYWVTYERGGANAGSPVTTLSLDV